MDAGTFDQRIEIQRAAITTDEFNEPIYNYFHYATNWAQATPISDGERARANEVYSAASYRFLIRWSLGLADLDTVDRILWDNRTWDIIGVKAIGRNDRLEITAAARAERT